MKFISHAKPVKAKRIAKKKKYKNTDKKLY